MQQSTIEMSASGRIGNACRLVDTPAVMACAQRLLAAWEGLPESDQFDKDGSCPAGSPDWTERLNLPSGSRKPHLPTWLRALGIARPYEASDWLQLHQEDLWYARLADWIRERPSRMGYEGRQKVRFSESKFELVMLLCPLERPVDVCASLLWNRGALQINESYAKLARNPYLIPEELCEGAGRLSSEFAFTVEDIDRALGDATWAFQPERTRARLIEVLANKSAGDDWIDEQEDMIPEDSREFVSRKVWAKHGQLASLSLRDHARDAALRLKTLVNAQPYWIPRIEEVVGTFKLSGGNFYGKVLTVNGVAGSGKSHYMIEAIGVALGGVSEVAGASKAQRCVAVVAPTGRAAAIVRTELDRRARNLTQYMDVTTIDDFLRRVRVGRKQKLDYLFIDEASMVDTEKMGRLLSSINLRCLKLLVMVGDACQLPPVGSGKPFRSWLDYANRSYSANVKYFPETHRTTSGGAEIELASHLRPTSKGTEKVSQGRRPFRSLLSQLPIDRWTEPDELIHKLEEFYGDSLKPSPGNSFIEGALNTQVICGRRNGRLGTAALNRHFLKGVVPTTALGVDLSDLPEDWPRGLIKVIQNRNKWMPYWKSLEGTKIVGERVPNGAIGVLLGFNKGHGRWKVKFREFPKRYFCYTSREVKKLLDVGYLCTIHRSQGSTFDRVALVLTDDDLRSVAEGDLGDEEGTEDEEGGVVDAGPVQALYRELLYTGLTRHRYELKILSQRTGPTDVLSRILNENLLVSAIENRRCFVNVLLNQTRKERRSQASA